ncbi:MAG: serine/threonine protein kinase [Phycisphaeraceae bacterium]|nr:serine/threonine protein kinase [Phycisphaerales bacterium]MCB9858943.1 serine/threonine protein kinase [Phycisphaeraceae bacterium]
MPKRSPTTPPDQSTWSHIEHLFHQAMDVNGDARESFLHSLSESDAEQVRRLLHASATHGTGFLEPPEVVVVPQSSETPLRIGDFTILRTVARGGMGIVYEAEQATPKRRVALKVLPRAIAKGSSARLAHEASVLARLLHPAVAQMYSMGVDDQGTPFLAIELVENAQTLNAWAKGKPERDILDIFVRISHGVHHGHQRGVVHRDLKPTNVLVNNRDEPKVIDFGIARLTENDVERITQEVDRSKLLGTLAYMSPEQCAGNTDEIDARTDIYSLGVVLYELLTGSLPHPVESKPITEAIRLVRDTPPRRPMRNGKPLPTDLEAIVMKAMARQPSDRYASASEFADDIQRYLHNEPTRAKPPGTRHAISLFAKRHRAAVASIVAISIVLLGTVGTLGVMNAQLTRAESRAVAERDAANKARDLEKQQRILAEQIANIMRNSLRSANPELTEGAELTMREYLDQTSTMIDTVEDPLVASKLFLTMSEAYFALGQFEVALQHAEIGLGRAESAVQQDASSAESLELVAPLVAAKASALVRLGKGEEALALMQPTVDLLKESRLEDSDLYGELLSRVGDAQVQMGNFAAAQATFEQGLLIREKLFQPPDIDLGESHNNLANVLWQLGKRDEAERHWQAALENFSGVLNESHPYIATALGNLGHAYEMKGDHEKAEDAYVRSLQLREQTFGKDNLSLAVAWERLGIFYNNIGRYEEADRAFARMNEIRSLHLDVNHPQVANGILNQAYAYIERKDFERANELLERAVAIHEAIYPSNHPAVGGALFLRASALVGMGRPDEALPFARSAWELRAASYGRESWRAANAQSLYGECLVRTGSTQEGENLLRESLDLLSASLPPNHSLVVEARQRLDLVHGTASPTR